MRKFLTLVALVAAVIFAFSPASSAGDAKKLKIKKVLYDGPHPTPDMKMCNEEGLHFHDYGPVKGAKFHRKPVQAYKFTGKVFWICGKHPINKKELYEKNNRHMQLERPYPFPRYQFDKSKDCYSFKENLHWICGKHPIKGTKMYKKGDRHYWIGDPGGWPDQYTEDGGNKCFRWKRPEAKLKVKDKPPLQIAPGTGTKKVKKDKDKDKGKGKKKGLKEAGDKDKGKKKGKKKGLKVAE